MVNAIRLTFVSAATMLVVGLLSFGCAASPRPLPEYPDPGDPPVEDTELWDVLAPPQEEQATTEEGAGVEEESFEDLPDETPAPPPETPNEPAKKSRKKAK